MTVEAEPRDLRDDEINALRGKYDRERERRQRADGNSQYIPADGDFARFSDDPFADPRPDREPLNEDADVVVVGGGFAGLMTCVRLKMAGIENFRLIEKGGDFGGTWYWNRYPGAACDIESYCYMPLLEETGYIPTEKYAKAPEIFEYCKMLAEKFGLYDKALFQTRATELRWEAENNRWRVTTDKGDVLQPRFVCLSVGGVSRPKLPGIPGIGDFKGKAFHTCRWDYGYTGGDPQGEMTQLRDKRVALIGTGATAVQVLPQLAQWAQQVYLFQRTPSPIGPRGNRKTDPDFAAGLQPGWHFDRLLNFEAASMGMIRDQAGDLVSDGWTEMGRRLMVMADEDVAANSFTEKSAQMMQRADMAFMEDIRARVADTVKDPEAAAALKPYYDSYCKRQCFHDEYLEAFNQDNVKLVDTRGGGVDRITKRGLVVSRREYEVDCIIFATGFEIMPEAHRAADVEIVGAGGITLRERWADEYQTLHGISVDKFPNFFLVGSFRQAGGSVNATYVFDIQSTHVAATISELMNKGVVRAEVKTEAVESWQAALAEKTPAASRYLSQCTPGYYNNEGKGKGLIRDYIYGGGSLEYGRILSEWRESAMASDFALT